MVVAPPPRRIRERRFELPEVIITFFRWVFGLVLWVFGIVLGIVFLLTWLYVFVRFVKWAWES